MELADSFYAAQFNSADNLPVENSPYAMGEGYVSLEELREHNSLSCGTMSARDPDGNELQLPVRMQVGAGPMSWRAYSPNPVLADVELQQTYR